MKRLEKENHNTREYYNKVLLAHYTESGLDYSDTWRVDALLEKYKGGKLIDIGCGVCPLINIAENRFNSEVYGVDFADELISALKGDYSRMNYQVADFYSLPFEDETFDYAVLGEVIEHSEDPEKLVSEAMRVLKKGGTLAVSVPIDETEENHLYEQHIWSFTEEDIIKLVGKGKKIGNTYICHKNK